MAEKIEHMIPPSPKSKIVEGGGLVPVNPLIAYVKSKTSGSISPRETGITRSDARAGMMDGKKVSVNKAMNTNNNTSLIGK